MSSPGAPNRLWPDVAVQVRNVFERSLQLRVSLERVELLFGRRPVVDKNAFAAILRRDSSLRAAINTALQGDAIHNSASARDGASLTIDDVWTRLVGDDTTTSTVDGSALVRRLVDIGVVAATEVDEPPRDGGEDVAVIMGRADTAQRVEQEQRQQQDVPAATPALERADDDGEPASRSLVFQTTRTAPHDVPSSDVEGIVDVRLRAAASRVALLAVFARGTPSARGSSGGAQYASAASNARAANADGTTIDADALLRSAARQLRRVAGEVGRVWLAPHSPSTRQTGVEVRAGDVVLLLPDQAESPPGTALVFIVRLTSRAVAVALGSANAHVDDPSISTALPSRTDLEHAWGRLQALDAADAVRSDVGYVPVEALDRWAPDGAGAARSRSGSAVMMTTTSPSPSALASASSFVSTAGGHSWAAANDTMRLAQTRSIMSPMRGLSMSTAAGTSSPLPRRGPPARPDSIANGGDGMQSPAAAAHLVDPLGSSPGAFTPASSDRNEGDNRWWRSVRGTAASGAASASSASPVREAIDDADARTGVDGASPAPSSPPGDGFSPASWRHVPWSRVDTVAQRASRRRRSSITAAVADTACEVLEAETVVLAEELRELKRTDELEVGVAGMRALESVLDERPAAISSRRRASAGDGDGTRTSVAATARGNEDDGLHAQPALARTASARTLPISHLVMATDAVDSQARQQQYVYASRRRAAVASRLRVAQGCLSLDRLAKRNAATLSAAPGAATVYTASRVAAR